MSEENQQQSGGVLNQSSGNGNIDRLTRIIGFNPSKGNSVGGAFADALKELNEERAKETKAKAKEFLSKAVDLAKKMGEAERQFNSQKKKFDKELGKLINNIESLSRGQEPQQETDGQQENV